jgi:transposase
MPRTTVRDYLHRAEAAGLAWPIPDHLDDQAIEDRLFVKPEDQQSSRPFPDWAYIHAEMRRKHMTLLLLWQEYKGQHPEDGYQYSQFCDLYREWSKALGVWMRQEHLGGDKLFVDFSGDGIPWTNPVTGEVREAALFVAVLGASNYTFAYAVPTQKLPDWLECHVKALVFIGGVPKVIVPDQPKTAVKRSCRYDPELNPAYMDLARHYGTAVIPARPRKPRDKAKVEVGVLLAQRWIIAALRNRTFFSIAEINEAIRPLLEKLNSRIMRKLARSRRDLFLEVDHPNLRPLPETAYEYAEWKVGIRVGFDYHIEFDWNYYSVPYRLAGEVVDIRANGKTVEVFKKHQSITDPDHMPSSHRAHADWNPERIIDWASKIGPFTAKYVDEVMKARQFPEHAFRGCLGIIRLGKRYTDERLEKACARGLAFKSFSFRVVKSILENKLEDQPLPSASNKPIPRHKNIRGSEYFRR